MLALSLLLRNVALSGAIFAAVLVPLLALTIVIEIVFRQFGLTNSIIMSDIQWHLHGAIALSAFGYVYTENGHVRVDVLSQHFSERTSAYIELLAILFVLAPFMIALMWFGIEFAHRSYRINEGGQAGLGLPYRFLIKSFIPISALLVLIAATAISIRISLYLYGEIEWKQVWTFK